MLADFPTLWLFSRLAFHQIRAGLHRRAARA
jgi:hypothetical protein